MKGQIEHVFVYGSLKRGESLYLLEPLVDLRLEVVPAQIQPALLYDLGPFPGMVLKNNSGVVMGEVHRYHQLTAVLRILDEIEQYYGEGDPHNLYRRVSHKAELLNEVDLVSCWLYEYVGPMEGASLIESGVWHGIGVEP